MHLVRFKKDMFSFFDEVYQNRNTFDNILKYSGSLQCYIYFHKFLQLLKVILTKMHLRITVYDIFTYHVYICIEDRMYIILRRNWSKTGVSGSSWEYSLISREIGETQ